LNLNGLEEEFHRDFLVGHHCSEERANEARQTCLSLSVDALHMYLLKATLASKIMPVSKLASIILGSKQTTDRALELICTYLITINNLLPKPSGHRPHDVPVSSVR